MTSNLIQRDDPAPRRIGARPSACGAWSTACPTTRASRCSTGCDRYDRIIVGAYTDRTGGVCPMLAAHRCGGRTDFRSFARAWDRFTGAGKRARRATEREVRTLTAQLEASIWAEDEPPRRRRCAPDDARAPAPRARAGARGSARSGAGTATATRCAARSGEEPAPERRARARDRRRLAADLRPGRRAQVRGPDHHHLGDRCRRARAAAGSARPRRRPPGRIISSCGDLAPDPLRHRRVDEARADRRAAHAVARELLGGRLGERDHRRPSSPSRRPAIPAGACPRSRPC